MTVDKRAVTVLKDETGEYFILTPEMLERGRVTEAHKAEVERCMGDADATGFATPRTIGQLVADVAWEMRLRQIVDQIWNQR